MLAIATQPADPHTNMLDFTKLADELKKSANGEQDADLPSDTSALIKNISIAFKQLASKSFAIGSLDEGQIETAKQCIRCMSNACAVYEAQARKELLGVVPDLMSAKFLESEQLWMVCLAFILNLSIDFGTSLDAFLYSSCTHHFEIEEGRNKCVELGLLKKFMDDLKQAGIHPDLEIITRVISSLIDCPAGLKQLEESLFLSFVLDQLKAGHAEYDDLFESLLLHEPVQVVFFRQGLMPSLMDSVQKFEAIELKENLAKMVSVMAGNDALMSELIGSEYPYQWMDWLKLGQQSDNIVMYGLLSLGNIARSKENCIALVHDFELLDKVIPFLTDSSMNVKHAALSVIKNVTIPFENKRLVGEHLYLIRNLKSLLTSPASPIQLGAIGVLKNLSADSVIAMEIVSNSDLLKALLDLAKGSDEEAVQFESFRVIIALVKSSKEARDMFITDFVNAQSVLDQILGRSRPFLVSRHAILKQEALALMALLFEDGSQLKVEEAEVALMRDLVGECLKLAEAQPESVPSVAVPTYQMLKMRPELLSSINKEAWKRVLTLDQASDITASLSRLLLEQ